MKLEIVHDDTLKVEELLRSNERLRAEYNELAAKHKQLISYMCYGGQIIGGKCDVAILALHVPHNTFHRKGAESAVFELLQGGKSLNPYGAL